MNVNEFLLSIGDPVIALGLAAFSLLLFALLISAWAVSGKTSSPTVRFLVALANLVLAAQMILRWWQSGHFPISNLYESLCFLAWACTFTQLLVERSLSSPLVAASSTPLALFAVAFASFALPERLQEASPLVPALRSSWLVMHVSVIMCSYAALAIGSLFSIVVLLVDRGDALEIRNSSIGVGGFRKGILPKVDSFEFDSFALKSIELNRIEQLDSLSYRTISVGFLLLTVGLISGAVWANEAWGSWWSWDPKETWALITWFVYAAYLHARLTRGWQGRKPALVALAGLFIVGICYIGVNFLGVGLHSYGWFLDA